MSGIEAIEKFISDVHTLKVLMFALYGWSFCATVFIAILFVRERRNAPLIESLQPGTLIGRFPAAAATNPPVSSATKKEGPPSQPNERK